jgi:cytochrome c5
MRLIVSAATLGLATCIGVAGLTNGPASAKVAATAAPPSAAVLAAGKGLISQYHCDGCHSANLHGKTKNNKPWSPNITEAGIMGKYNKATFVKALQTGVTPNGRKFKPPMPVFAKMSSHDAGTIYLYLAAQN